MLSAFVVTLQNCLMLIQDNSLIYTKKYIFIHIYILALILTLNDSVVLKFYQLAGSAPANRSIYSLSIQLKM